MPGQVAFVIGHPVEYLQILALSIWDRGPGLYRSSVGMLGWLQVPLPWFAYALPVVAMVLALVATPSTERRDPLWWTAWDAAILAASFVLIMTALYLYWNPVAAPIILGVQGRYFLPLSALAGVALCRLVPVNASVETRGAAVVGVVVIVAVLCGTTVYAVFEGYSLA